MLIVGALAGGTGVAAEAVRHAGARAAVEPGPAAVHERGASHSDWPGLAVPVAEHPDPLAAPAVDPVGIAPIVAHAPATATVPLASTLEAPLGDGHAPVAEPEEGSPEVDPVVGESLGLDEEGSSAEIVELDVPTDEPLPPPVPDVEPPPVDVVPADAPPPADLPPVDLPPVELPPVDLPPVEVTPVEVLPLDAPPADTLPADTPPADAPPADAPPADAPLADDDGEGESAVGDSPPPPA